MTTVIASLLGSHLLISSPNCWTLWIPYDFATTTAPSPISPATAVPSISALPAP